MKIELNEQHHRLLSEIVRTWFCISLNVEGFLTADTVAPPNVVNCCCCPCCCIILSFRESFGEDLTKISFAVWPSISSIAPLYNLSSKLFVSSVIFSGKIVIRRMDSSDNERSSHSPVALFIFRVVRILAQAEGDAKTNKAGMPRPKWAWILIMSFFMRMKVARVWAENIRIILNPFNNSQDVKTHTDWILLNFNLSFEGKQLTFKDGGNSDLNSFVDEHDFLFWKRLVRAHPDGSCCESGELAWLVVAIYKSLNLFQDLFFAIVVWHLYRRATWITTFRWLGPWKDLVKYWFNQTCCNPSQICRNFIEVRISKMTVPR